MARQQLLTVVKAFVTAEKPYEFKKKIKKPY